MKKIILITMMLAFGMMAMAQTADTTYTKLSNKQVLVQVATATDTVFAVYTKKDVTEQIKYINSDIQIYLQQLTELRAQRGRLIAIRDELNTY